MTVITISTVGFYELGHLTRRPGRARVHQVSAHRQRRGRPGLHAVEPHRAPRRGRDRRGVPEEAHAKGNCQAVEAHRGRGRGAHGEARRRGARRDADAVRRDRPRRGRRCRRLSAEVMSPAARCSTSHGDATADHVLLAAGVERARGVVAALTEDKDNLYVTLSARSLNATARIVSKVVEDEAAAEDHQGRSDGDRQPDDDRRASPRERAHSPRGHRVSRPAAARQGQEPPPRRGAGHPAGRPASSAWRSRTRPFAARRAPSSSPSARGTARSPTTRIRSASSPRARRSSCSERP